MEDFRKSGETSLGQGHPTYMWSKSKHSYHLGNCDGLSHLLSVLIGRHPALLVSLTRVDETSSCGEFLRHQLSAH
jgi:hypothetical protein